MKNILVINGHEYYDFAKGELNKTLFNHMAEKLEGKYNVKSTVVQDGYNVKEEQEKYKWADVVIIQFPIYWMNVPGLLKTYFDKVYEYGVFFQGSEVYGEGGMMKGKKVMFSTTWNAPKQYFGEEGFFEGKSRDEVLKSLYVSHKFIGMESLPEFSVHNVITEPKIDEYISSLDKHLSDVFGI